MRITSRAIAHCFVFILFFTALFFAAVPHAALAALNPQAASGPWTGTQTTYTSLPDNQFVSPLPTVVNNSTYQYNCSDTGVNTDPSSVKCANYQLPTDIYYCLTPSAGGNGGYIIISGGILFYGCQKDTTAPTIVPNVHASGDSGSNPAISPSAINVTWNPSTDLIGVVGYRVLVLIGTIYTQIGTVLNTGAASYAFTDGPSAIAPATLASGRTLTPSTSYIYGVVAYDASGNPSSYAPVTGVTLSGPPQPSVTTNLASSPGTSSATLNSSVNPNGSATTAWYLYSTSNLGASCSIASVGTVTPGVSVGSGTLAVSNPRSVSGLSASTTYYYCAIASNAGGTTYGNVVSFTTLTPPPTVSLSAAPTSIISGSSSMLSWSSTNATSCTATWTASTAISGSQSVTPAATTTYTISCTGGAGTTSQSTTVTVNIPPTVSLSATPTSITSGSSSTLSWSSTNATSCSGSSTPAGWTTSSLSGTQSVSPTTTTTYTISCTGPSGTASASTTVTVSVPSAPTVSLSATPASITSGSSSTLSWSSTNATSCTAAWTASTATTGSQSVTPAATTTYTISCTGGAGTTSQSTTVTVNIPPTVSLSATPTSITSGSSSTLSWSSTNATSCTATWMASTATSGTQSVSPTTTTTYTISCTGPSGTASASTTVAVTILYTLSVTTAGTGTGSVSSSPAGIACPATCSASFTSGISITLNASANFDSTFTNWSGACSGNGACSFTISANASVTATFADIVPPIVTITSPTTTSFPSGTTSVLLSGSTDENAICKYSTTTVFTGAPNFNTTGGTSHSQTLTTTDGVTYTYYIQCTDVAGNASTPVTVMFSVANPVFDTTPPVISGGAPSGTLAAGTASATLSVATNESAYCNYATTDTAYTSMPNTFTNVDPTHFSAPLSGLTNGTSYTYYARCQDNPAGNVNTSSYIISFNIATPGNQPPVALFSATPVSGFAPLSVSVDASASSDPDGTIVEYIWNWGDGSATTSPSTLNTHTYTTAGIYTLALTVVDNGNLSTQSGAASQTVTVSAVPLPVVTTVCTAACTTDADCISPNICGPAGVCINPAGAGGGPLRFDGAFTTLDGSNFQYAPAQYPGNTTMLYMSVRTDVNSTCQYILNTPNTFYGASTMTQFTKTGGLTHSVKIAGLKPGGTLTAPVSQIYDYYVKCKNTTGDFNTTDYPVSVTISAASIITPVADYLCLINPNFVKKNIPYFFDVCMRQCATDLDCKTPQTPSSTCDTVKKVCK